MPPTPTLSAIADSSWETWLSNAFTRSSVFSSADAGAGTIPATSVAINNRRSVCLITHPLLSNDKAHLPRRLARR